MAIRCEEGRRQVAGAKHANESRPSTSRILLASVLADGLCFVGQKGSREGYTGNVVANVASRKTFWPIRFCTRGHCPADAVAAPIGQTASIWSDNDSAGLLC